MFISLFNAGKFRHGAEQIPEWRNIGIFNGCEVQSEGNFSTSRGLPSDAELLPRVTAFSICTEQLL